VHARIRAGAGGVHLEDLGSKNGLFVNGVRVERTPIVIHCGDEIGVGETALALDEGTAVAAPRAAPPLALPLLARFRSELAATLLAACAAALVLASR
jgi:pSer/pThr/pTyr-binding forkhead associated (FHA) protein